MRPTNNNRGRDRDRDSQPQTKKQCFFCSNKMTTVDYKDSQTLRRFMSPHAKILAHNRTGTCPKHQRMVTKALKQARHTILIVSGEKKAAILKQVLQGPITDQVPATCLHNMANVTILADEAASGTAK